MFMNTGKDICLCMNTGNSVQGIDGYLYFYGTICQGKKRLIYGYRSYDGKNKREVYVYKHVYR